MVALTLHIERKGKEKRWLVASSEGSNNSSQKQTDSNTRAEVRAVRASPSSLVNDSLYCFHFTIFLFQEKVSVSNSKIQCDILTILLRRWTVMMEALSMASLSFPSISVSRSRWNSNYRPIKCAAQSLPIVDNADKFLEASKKGNVIPLYRCIFSDHLTPVLAYRCLVKEDERDAPSFLFESAEPGLQISSTVSYFNYMKHEHRTRHWHIDTSSNLRKWNNWM